MTLRAGKTGIAGLLLGCCSEASAFTDYSASDFGGIGLMQTPTARFAPDGELRGAVASMSPYNQLLMNLQLLPWLETGFRYTEVTNRLYGPEDFSGDQTYKDKGVDFKLRLWQEGEYLPALAIGVTDVGGTGLFGSEYLVASRRYYDFDFSLGLGWGRLGTRGGIGNPLGGLSDGFKERQRSRTGEFSVDSMFHGEEVALFGGVQWQTPLRGLSIKLEYDSNDYQSEAKNNPQDVDSPINAAFNYRMWNTLDLSAGIERGNTFMFRIAAYTNLSTIRGPVKALDPPATAAYQAEAAKAGKPLQPAAAPDAVFVERLREELARQSVQLRGFGADAERGALTVWFTQTFSNDQPLVLRRIGQTLAVMAPADYQAFTLINLTANRESYRATLFRKQLQDEIEYRGSPEELAASAVITPPQRPALQGASVKSPVDYPAFDWGMGPALRQSIGGPDDFYLGQLWWRANATLALTPNLSASTTLGANIYNNFDSLDNRRFPGALPHVRSDIAQYLKEGQNNLVKLEGNYIWSPARNWLARFSGGLFEEMYGGVAGELLYRRDYAPWAVGFNINRVRQRDFDQRFDFRDYEVTTGHLTGYFDLPFYQLHANISYGRYLARDWGATLELSREFSNGIGVGAFATKTNVSAEDFGEGSFDKGFFVYVPLDMFFVRSSRKGTLFAFRPLTRDGGQKVRDGVWLYGVSEEGHLDVDPAGSLSGR